MLLDLGGTLAYSAISGIGGLTEYRRNYPLYPALLFLGEISMARRDHDEAKQVPATPISA